VECAVDLFTSPADDGLKSPAHFRKLFYTPPARCIKSHWLARRNRPLAIILHSLFLSDFNAGGDRLPMEIKIPPDDVQPDETNSPAGLRSLLLFVTPQVVASRDFPKPR
jgi:hypothetical protein